MVEIKITDAYGTPRAQLLAVAALLSTIANGTIAAEDNPAVGAPEPIAAPIVAQQFTTDPALAAFGPAGNVAPAVSSPNGATPAITAPPVNAPAGVELDKNGLPWDARIHASTKARNADQSWRNKRNVDASIVATVEAELRAVMGAPGPNVGAVASQVAPAPVGQIVGFPPPPAHAAPSVGNVPPPPQAQTVAPPSASVSASPPIATGAPAPITYPEIAQRITAAMTAQTLTGEQVTAACVQYGVPAFPLLATRPDLVPAVAAALGLV